MYSRYLHMSCHNHSCGHEHDDADHIRPGEGQQDLLYLSVDRDQVTALNEKVSGSGSAIIKPYDGRNDETRFLESDLDDDLLIHIPFAGSVRIRSLLLKSGPADETPRAIHIYKNADQLPIEDAAAESPPPTQKLTSIPESRDVVEIPLLAARFPDVQSITLYVPGSRGGERGLTDPHTRIYYIGFRGEALVLRRAGPQNLIYESAPRATDHTRIRGTDAGANPL